MKQLLTTIFTVSILSLMAQGHPPEVSLDTLPNHELRDLHNNAFQPGEYLRYRLHYGLLYAGEAVITVDNCDKQIQGRALYHVVGTGQTLGAFNWFYKVRDRYESYIDKKGVFPWIFIRHVNEGGYKINQNYMFYQEKHAVKTEKDSKIYLVKPDVQDMISAFYYARTLKFDTASVGDVYTIHAFVDGVEWPLKIKYLGKEDIDIRAGKFHCLKFVPVVQKGRIFKDSNDLQVWITDDGNRIPILAKAQVLVGSIKMEVVEYKGLAHPIAKFGK